MLSSCPVKAPELLGRLTSGRLLRLLAPAAGVALVAVVLYNATSVDRVPPTYQIRLSATAPNSSLALTLTSVNVVFSEQVDHKSAESAFSITPTVRGSFHWQGTTLIFTPSDKLPLSSTFVAKVASGVRDLAGNAQGNGTQLIFSTVGSPRVVTISPGDRAAAVAVDGSIKITFDRLMDPRPVLDGLRVEPPIAFTPTWTGPTLTLRPTQPLAYSTTYYVKIGDPAVDTDGTRLPAFISTFTTVGMGLALQARVPASNVIGVSVLTQIGAFFDGPIDPASIANAVTLTPPAHGSVSLMTLPATRQPLPSASASASASPTPTAGPATGNNVLVFTPDQPLASHTTYTVSISAGVRGVDGKAALPQTWTFTTGEPATSALNQIAFLSDRSGISTVWLMNPDGSNQRQVTAELTPVAAFDVSGDGTTIAYETAGVVRVMTVGGANRRTITAAGGFEYGATFTPDGTALVVGRRDAAGVDQGYWRVPLVSGVDQKRIAADGAPMPPDAAETEIQLNGQVGDPIWAPRAAFSSDGSLMLVVRGSDNVVELVDLTGTSKNLLLPLVANSRPIWDGSYFYVIASPDSGLTWSCWRIFPNGAFSRIGPGAGDLAASVSGSVAYVVRSADGSTHIAFADAPDGVATMLTNDPTWNEASPSFAPDGSMVVFGRFGSINNNISGGIWIVKPDGTGLVNLSTDGAFPRWLP